MPSFCMYGLRSIQPPELQNAPVLSAVKDCATSGEFPPRMAAMILSSLLRPPTFTVRFGCSWWNASTACCTTPSSRFVNPFQSVIVTGFAVSPLDALDVLGVLLPPPPPPPQATTSAAEAVRTAATLIAEPPS